MWTWGGFSGFNWVLVGSLMPRLCVELCALVGDGTRKVVILCYWMLIAPRTERCCD
ncbi:hypothetical protein M758_3G100600 [Ceratodon purpureus]|nr:hypothetical protein M758_3G100600 [Ceratodon purpureus]